MAMLVYWSVYTLVFQNPPVIPCEDPCLDPKEAFSSSGGVSLWVQTDTDPHVRYDWKTRGKPVQYIQYKLVGGFNPSEKY